MISKNPITGKSFKIPSHKNDRANIDEFISKNQGKKIVVVQGLGFVGSVMSLVVANSPKEEYAVIGIDLPTKETYWKIASINEGDFPVESSDKKVSEYFQNAIAKGNLFATFDPYAYELGDVIIVDINLDVKKSFSSDYSMQDYNLDLSSFRNAIATIGKHFKEEALILVETTVPPGTCEKVIKPILDKYFHSRKLAKSYFLGHSYERVMPGPNYIDSIQNFYRVYSGINEESANKTEDFLKSIIYIDEYPLTRLGSTNATEIAKVLENSFRAMNIAFIDEWTKFAEIAGVNLYEIIRAIRMRPTHNNIMFPGLGVGGYCLPKDPLLASWAKKNLFESESGLPQSEKAVNINDTMPSHSFEVIQKYFGASLRNKKVAILGISYLNDIGDTRYSPVEMLYNKLIEKGCYIHLYDPYVYYWAESNVHTNQNLDAIFEEKLDILIFGTGHSEFKNSNKINQLINEQQELFILDTMSLLSEKEISNLNKKHIVKVIGRGDI